MSSVIDGEYPGATHNPAAADALRPVLASRALAKCRVLTVVCPNSHTLLQVIRTPKGLVVTGTVPIDRVRHRGQLPGTSRPSHSTHTSRANRATVFCSFLEDLLSLGDHSRPYAVLRVVQCRCTSAELHPWEIEALLKAGRRRVVHAGSAQRS